MKMKLFGPVEFADGVIEVVTRQTDESGKAFQGIGLWRNSVTLASHWVTVVVSEGKSRTAARRRAVQQVRNLIGSL